MSSALPSHKQHPALCCAGADLKRLALSWNRLQDGLAALAVRLQQPELGLASLDLSRVQMSDKVKRQRLTGQCRLLLAKTGWGLWCASAAPEM